MSFFSPITETDLQYDGFFDGQNKIIPDGTELTAVIYDGFNGTEEGKAVSVCYLNIMITTEGEFYGQKSRYNAKIYDVDAAKRDLAMRNLQVVDAQAGLPMTNGRMELTTENIKTYWAGAAEVRVKFGLMVSERDGKEVNFVRGFAYLREKMRKPSIGHQSQQYAQPQTQQYAHTQQPQAPKQPRQPAPSAFDQDIQF